jgi:predicted kinase
MIGSGKSTVANHLGRELGVQVLSSDRIRKELFNPLVMDAGEAGCGIYTQKADTDTYSELLNRCIELLEKGESVIVDATFRRTPDRESFRMTASAAGSAVCLVITSASEETILQRLSERKVTPDRYSDAGVENYNSIAEKCDWPDPVNEQFVSVSTSGEIADGVDIILRSLGVLE